MSRLSGILDILKGDAQADRVVPRRGHSERLSLFTSGAMAFLAVFALFLVARVSLEPFV